MLNRDFADLAMLALTGTKQDVRIHIGRAIKRSGADSPDIAEELMQLLINTREPGEMLRVARVKTGTLIAKLGVLR